MTCKVHFYVLNEHFSIEHAEAHHNGEPSEMNRKYRWEDELNVTTNTTDVKEEEKTSYFLQGEMPNGDQFKHEVKGMRLFHVFDGEQLTAQIGCSETILDSFTLNKEEDAFVLKVYIKDNEPLANPVPGIYIASQEFPKELIV
jgi:hypothetical protein